MRTVCVFCGSREGARPSYAAAARWVGALIAEGGLRLVYGGGRVGLMGAVADAALEGGGEVVGVIPQALVDVELAHAGLTDLRIVGTMHERKQLMADLSDAFLALPGGYGTLEEFAEILSWAQLGIHRKPFGLLDVEGYYDPLIALLDRAVEEGFADPDHRRLVLTGEGAKPLLDALARHESTETERWVSPWEL